MLIEDDETGEMLTARSSLWLAVKQAQHHPQELGKQKR
jgi:hypothetical protein